jgi:hypothetical protein
LESAIADFAWICGHNMSIRQGARKGTEFRRTAEEFNGLVSKGLENLAKKELERGGRALAHHQKNPRSQV